jgi:hypothetical protein
MTLRDLFARRVEIVAEVALVTSALQKLLLTRASAEMDAMRCEIAMDRESASTTRICGWSAAKLRSQRSKRRSPRPIARLPETCADRRRMGGMRRESGKPERLSAVRTFRATMDRSVAGRRLGVQRRAEQARRAARRRVDCARRLRRQRTTRRPDRHGRGRPKDHRAPSFQPASRHHRGGPRTRTGGGLL